MCFLESKVSKGRLLNKTRLITIIFKNLGKMVELKTEILTDFCKIKMKNFSFTKMWFEPIFFIGSLAVFKIAAKPLNFGACCLAAVGGEKCSNYFQYSAPLRKGQRLVPRSAGLGDQIVGNFKGKNQLAILCPVLQDSKRKFFHF